MVNRKVRLKIKDVNDMLLQNDNVNCNEPYKFVILTLNFLQEAISKGLLAPLPYDLKNSLYDPDLLELRTDEEFCQVYDSDFKGTAEECIVSLICFVLKYDITYKKARVHTTPKDFTCTLGFTSKPLRDISRFSGKLADTILKRENGMDMEKKMLYMAYNYFIQFAEAMRFDINAFVKWYLRRINIK